MTNNIYINNYKIDYNTELGKGGTSTVYKCYDASNNVYAIKIVEKQNKIKHKSLMQNEISILKLLNSPYVINLINFFEDDYKYYLVLEFATTNFISIIETINTKDIFKYLKQLVKCIIYIQSLNVVHNDIKPANILVEHVSDNEYKLKLCDFGMSADMDNNHNFFCGSPIYMNIERLEGNYKSNSDFWALKIIYYYMVYGSHPYDNIQTIKDLIIRIKQGIKFPYTVNNHTKILSELFSNVIKTPHDLLARIECIENDFITDYPKRILKPYTEMSIFVNISSIMNDDSEYCTKMIDEEFEDFLLLN